MSNFEIDEEVHKRLTQLSEKYQVSGQDLVSYLDGLLYSDYLTYWDYIHLDTLLSLQSPRTPIKDEMIFIMYHQTTELYFKMIQCEMEQISENPEDAKFFLARLGRINRYFRILINSFDVMVDGMEREQFLKFRMALLPASGFQSAQYRMIEIRATDFINLVSRDERRSFHIDSDISSMYQKIYWKFGATDLASGKKTLTLTQFEQKYSEELIGLGKDMRHKNLYHIYRNLPKSDNKEKLRTEMRRFDAYVNVNWPLAHYKSAVRYLEKDPVDIAATGGTNWQKYLPPRFQRRIFFPALYTSEESENWGKAWVEREVFGLDN